MQLLLAPLALLACERAPSPQPEVVTPEPEVVTPAGARLENGRPARLATPAPVANTIAVEPDLPLQTASEPPVVALGPLAPPAIVTATGKLPVPPSIERAKYQAWKFSLSPDERLQLNRYCQRHPHDFRRSCGGIGPLHIPMPPHVRKMPVARNAAPSPRGPTSAFASLDDWRAALTPQQRAYVKRHCDDMGEERPDSDLCGANTPLVVSFDGAPVAFAPGGHFAFQPGVPTATDWPTAATPWIALDGDGDGAITSGAELFGTDTRLPNGARADHGFIALAQYDANQDRLIDRRDPIFASLLLWSDTNHDQHSSPAELTPLSSRVSFISLEYEDTAICDARTNCEGPRAGLTWTDAAGAARTGAVIDVYLPHR